MEQKNGLNSKVETAWNSPAVPLTAILTILVMVGIAAWQGSFKNQNATNANLSDFKKSSFESQAELISKLGELKGQFQSMNRQIELLLQANMSMQEKMSNLASKNEVESLSRRLGSLEERFRRFETEFWGDRK